MGDGFLPWLRSSESRLLLERLSPSTKSLFQGGWLLFSTVFAGVLNYLSNTYVGRLLGPADYGIFASLLSFFTVLSAFTEVAQTVVTFFVARLRGRGSTAEVGALLVYWFRRLLLWGVGGAVVLTLLSKPLAAFLQLSSSLAVVITCLSLIPMMLLPVVNGGLAGLQRFGAFGGVQISAAAFRLAIVVGLIILGLGATGAVASLPLSSLAALALGAFFLGDTFRWQKRADVPAIDGLLDYSLHVALSTVCFAVLTFGDVIMVKSRFPASEAGLYSAVATLGKLSLFPSVLAILLMPKATEQHVRGRSSADLLRKSLLAVGLLCGSITLAFFLFPTPIVGIFFGEQYVDHASLLGPYALAMMLYALVNVWRIYYLAIDEKRFAYVLLIGVVLLIALLALSAPDLTEVVVVLVGVGSVLYLGGEVLLLVTQRKRQ